MNSKEEKSQRSRSARRRGKTFEYNLRNHLRTLGYTAERVPSSGAARGFKGDVVADKDGKRLIFESKAHEGKYTKFWPMVSDYLKAHKTPLFSVYLGAPIHKACDIAFDLAALIDKPKHGLLYPLPENLELDQKKWAQTLRRLPKVYEMQKEADILVLAENRKPFLFLRFR